MRPRLASQLGSIAAAIHAVDLSRLPQLPLLDAERQVQHLHSQYRAQETSRPVFELAFRWLREHLPPAVTPVLVHGDYRHGNLIIGAQGVHAVLDWELAHIGDPAEDLAWMCIPPWRFGELDKPVGGFGQREDLLDCVRARERQVDRPSETRVVGRAREPALGNHVRGHAEVAAQRPRHERRARDDRAARFRE